MTKPMQTPALLTTQHILILTSMLLLSTFAQPSFANEVTDRTVQAFFSQVSQKNVDAAAKIIVGTTDAGHVQNLSEQLKKLRLSLSTLSTSVGDYVGNEQIIEKAIGSRFVHVQYLAYFKQEPIQFKFSFYRYKKEWRVLDFSFDYDFSAQVKTLANQQLISAKPSE